MNGVKFNVNVLDKATGQPLVGAKVSGVLNPLLTDSAGNALVETVSISIEADGYIPYLEQPYVNPPGLSIALEPRTGPPAPPPPPPSSLHELQADGAFFTVGGQPFTVIQTSAFALLARHQNGDDISDSLQCYRDGGFNTLRVWTLFDIDTIGLFTTIDYSAIPRFVALCAAYGLYVEFTAYTGINDPSHWSNLCQAALACTPYPLLELVNEWDVNYTKYDAQGRLFHIEQYEQAPAPLLSAHGSNGSERLPVRPAWSYEDFHTNSAPEWPRKNGHNAMEVSDGTLDWSASHAPVITNESTRCPDRDDNPLHYYDAAAGAALLCAGSCFHSVNGKAGRPWTPQEELCAVAHAAGAHSVDLRYQSGRYQRLDPGTDLRVYQRVLPDGTAATVRIRK